MRAEFPQVRTLDLARSMNRSLDSVRSRAVILGLTKTPDTLHRINIERDKSKSAATRFAPGFTPWNKGVTDYRLPSGAPLGTERVRGGYHERKVKMDGPPWQRWRFVHVLLYEEKFGPVPAGCLVTFRDGNPDHCTLDNLVVITQSQNMARHSAHLYGPELFRLMQLRGAITRQLNKRKKQA